MFLGAKAFLKKYPQLPVVLFFVAYLLLGLAIYDDYGVSTDEVFQIEKAILNLDYITGKNTDLLEYPDRHYGAILAIPLYLIGGTLADPRGDYLLRHLTTFLIFFISSIFFYRLARHLKLNRTIALIGTAIYIFHPHIFSHSFYNIKDIPFLAVYLLNLYALVLWSEKPSWTLALLNGFLSGILVVFRLPGLLMWGITFLVWAWMLLLNPRAWRSLIPIGALYAFTAILTLYAFLPILWHDPIGEAVAFFSMDLFEWGGKELFMGNFLRPEFFPRYYLPVYMLVTTPLGFTFLLGIGTLVILYQMFVRLIVFKPSSLPRVVLMLALYLPILYIIIARPIIYNGWRHVFFVYAPFALIAALGLQYLWNWFSSIRHHLLRATARAGLILLLFAQAASLVWFLIVSHPYQHVYYNRLAAPDLSAARTQYSMDYWGLAYRGALEMILRYDDRPVIRVTASSNHLLTENLRILPLEQRQRFVVNGPKQESDYYLTHYRYEFRHNEPGHVFWREIEVLGAPIHGIYKITPAAGN